MEVTPIRVTFLGLRGFPGVQGGVEAHAEHLCPLLAGMGCEVEVIVRSPYQNPSFRNSWRGVRFTPLWAPRSRALETVVHTLLGVLYAGLIRRPDVLHIHAIGPALLTPLARLLGLRLVVTHHGPDYERQKWGGIARAALRLGEWAGMRGSHGRIAISAAVRLRVQQKHGFAPEVIHNGIFLPEIAASMGALGKFDLLPGKYILLVSRLVPEKRHLDLIEAFRGAALAEWKLVIVGAADHPDDYSRRVRQAGARTAGVVCTGFQSGQALHELYSHAGMFVLPSSHEGLPIVMLEALSYGLPVIASAISANLEVGLPEEHYFPVSDVAALAVRLRQFAARPVTQEARDARRMLVVSRFDWQNIARQTVAVYRAVMSGQRV